MKINFKDSLDYIVPAAITFAVLGVASIFFRPVVVSGISMEPNFHEDDRVIASTLADISKGDVVVFKSKSLKRVLIKRVIAEAGDTVDIDFDNGIVYVNNKALDESAYMNEPTINDEGGHDYPVIVPDNCYFVMGDNRLQSLDSRSEEVSFVNKDTIIGKVIYKFGD